MSPASSPSTLGHHRLRILFRKQGDLRWISHRDLMRVMERLCRRAELELLMSKGFHPKPKLHFPSALGLGIEGLNEVMELELSGLAEPRSVQQTLNSLAPPGLVIIQVVPLEPSRRKAKARSMTYRFPVPVDRWTRTETAIEKLKAAPTFLVERDGRQQPIDILANLMSVERDGDAVCFRLRAADQAAARPRDILEAIGLADLEKHGHFLSRSEVEMVS